MNLKSSTSFLQKWVCTLSPASNRFRLFSLCVTVMPQGQLCSSASKSSMTDSRSLVPVQFDCSPLLYGADKDKYVFLTCTDGCRMFFHHGCWKEVEKAQKDAKGSCWKLKVLVSSFQSAINPKFPPWGLHHVVVCIVRGAHSCRKLKKLPARFPTSCIQSLPVVGWP